jgi:hypothetical protein
MVESLIPSGLPRPAQAGTARAFHKPRHSPAMSGSCLQIAQTALQDVGQLDGTPSAIVESEGGVAEASVQKCTGGEFHAMSSPD